MVRADRERGALLSALFDFGRDAAVVAGAANRRGGAAASSSSSAAATTAAVDGVVADADIAVARRRRRSAARGRSLSVDRATEVRDGCACYAIGINVHAAFMRRDVLEPNLTSTRRPPCATGNDCGRDRDRARARRSARRRRDRALAAPAARDALRSGGRRGWVEQRGRR